MKFTLPSGQEVQLGIFHKKYAAKPSKKREEEPLPKEFWEQHGITFARGTEIWLKVGRKEYKSRSVCKPPDPFCKATGRRKAANRLLAQLGAHDLGRVPVLTKADRRAIFYKICREFDPCPVKVSPLREPMMS